MVLWCTKSFGKKATLAQIDNVTRQRAWLCYFTIFSVFLPLRCSFKQNHPKSCICGSR